MKNGGSWIGLKCCLEKGLHQNAPFQSLNRFLACIQYNFWLTFPLRWEGIVKLVSPAEEMQLEDNKLAFVSDPALPTELLTSFQLQNCYSWWWRIRRNFLVNFYATQQGWLEKCVRQSIWGKSGSAESRALSLIILKVIFQRGRVNLCTDLWLLKYETLA